MKPKAAVRVKQSVSISDIYAHQKDYERMFCASLLMSGMEEVAASECAWLSPSKFRSELYGRFWELVLEGHGAIKAATDLDLFVDLTKDVMTIQTGNIDITQYAEVIAEDAYIADIMSGTSNLVKAVSVRDFDAINAGIDGLRGVSMANGASGGKDADEIHAEFSAVIQVGGGALSTGIVGLDHRVGGLFKGELIIVAGRPGMGKTAFVTQIGRNVAVSGRRVAMFSLEMSAVQVWARMTCHLAGVEWKNVRAGAVSTAELAAVELASETLRQKLGSNFVIIDDVYTVSGIHQASISLKPDLVLIDQLPDIDWYNKEESEVTWYGKALKYLRQNIARKMDVPLVVNHQLNRGVENRQDKRPTLSDLRLSGEVEQRADIVWLMYRDDYYVGRSNGQVNVSVEVNTAKNRQGDSGDTVMLNYNLKEQWFS